MKIKAVYQARKQKEESRKSLWQLQLVQQKSNYNLLKRAELKFSTKQESWLQKTKPSEDQHHEQSKSEIVQKQLQEQVCHQGGSNQLDW